MKRTDRETENKVISEYNSGKSLAKIGRLLGLSPVTVMNILNRNNIQLRTKGGIYRLDEDSVINSYRSGQTCKQIAENFNVCLKTICNILEKNGIDRDNIYHNISLINNYWENIDTYDKAYFLGFLITDGNVFGNEVRLQLSSKDEYILKIFSDKTNNSNQIYKDKRGFSAFSIKRKSWVNDLSKYGVIPNKTSTVFLPGVNENLMPHLLRGIFDGDGWITFKGHTIGLCGNETLTTQVRDYLVNKLGVFNVKVIKNNDNLWSVSWSSKRDIKLIGEFLYKDKKDCYLTRKFDNYTKIIQVDTEVSSEISKGSETP